MLGKRRPTGDAWAAYVTWAGSDAVGRPLFAPRKTPHALVQQLREAFAKLDGDKEFMAELKKVGGDDADLLQAKDAEPVLRQVLTLTPGVQEFVKKHHQETSATLAGKIRARCYRYVPPRVIFETPSER